MKLKRVWQGIAAGLFLSLVLTPVLAVPIHADGGPILSDPELWAQIEEGTQTATVRLDEDEDTAQVDLFVSLLDASGESHEIIFFLPLGSQPTAFDVREENSFDFEAAQTEELDSYLGDAAEWQQDYQSSVCFALLPGTLLVNGAWWSWFFWLPSIFGPFGMMGAMQAPLETFQTEHSLIELYDIDAETDLGALIATTGLDPAVQETLRRLEGQQIAVVTMQTQAAGEAGTEGGASGPYGISGQQGLHLAWTTRLVPGDEGATYAYPLGTGSAWAHPIELTRVYVVAPPGVDFHVAYPQLGEDRSGYAAGGFYGRLGPRIMQHTDTPGYAVDQAVGDFGRVWRATYVQSNAAEDVIVARVEGLLPETRAVLRRHAVQQWTIRLTWAIGLLAALVIWVAAWRFVMSRRLGFSYRWLNLRLWGHAVGWALVYLVSNAVLLTAGGLLAFGVAGLFWRSDWIFAVMTVPTLLLLGLTSLGVVSGLLFSLIAKRTKGIPWGKAAGAYALVVLASNVGYGLFALAYLALVGRL